ncbi:MAG TPA: methylenetetrahydrofolate reductase [Myxococcota bacterium]|nr:methylenetetrahydrofolate reductase [Myxococcota bacterium]
MTAPRVALEITPPREPRPEILLRRAQLLGERAAAVHVIQRRERQPSVAAAGELAQRGIAAVWHLVSRGRSAAELEREIAQAARLGLRAALVVRGEAGAPEPAPPPPLAQLVRDVRAAIPGARVGVTATPYGPRERVLARLWPKLEAGAAFVQTQPVFELAALAPLAEAVRRRAPRVEIVPMLIPLLSSAAAEALSQRLRLPVPEALLRRLESGGEVAGWSALASLARELTHSGLADSLAVMTLDADPPKPFGERLAAALASSV